MDILPNSDLLIKPLLLTFVLGFASFLLLLWYSMKKQSYWKQKGLPYATPVPILGSVWENARRPLHETELTRYNKFGRIYGHYEGSRALLSVGDPDLLREIMVKDFPTFTGRRDFSTDDEISDNMLSLLSGEKWKRVRTIVTPTFTTGKIKKMTSILKECANTLVKNFKESAEKGVPVDCKSIYGAFSMDVIASSAFSSKIDSHNDPNNLFVTTARGLFFSKGINWRFILFGLFPEVMRFFKIHLFSPTKMKFFKNVTLQIMEERKRTGQVRNDFLQLLIDTAKEISEEGKSDMTEKNADDILENYGKNDNEQVFNNAYLKKTLSLNELVAQCVVFFLAGYDTTSSTLAFTTYFLALHPDVQEKLVEEVDKVLKENNDELTYEAIQSMRYMDNVISETLRFFPSVMRLERLADEDYKLGDTGITVPKGMLVTIPIYAIHRDPELFPDPEKFDPERFNPEERAKRHPYSYMPFGAGPRNCVGLRFALMEVKICLAYVLSNFRIKKCAQTKVPLDFYIGEFTLQPKDVTVKMILRNDYVKSL